MIRSQPWPRILIILGFVAMLIGVLDPLEGALVILPGTALVALGALRSHSPHRRFLLWSPILVALGVGAMFLLSAMGGLGGTGGRSIWWALLILPYPIGWIMGVVGTIRVLREPAAPNPSRR